MLFVVEFSVVIIEKKTGVSLQSSHNKTDSQEHEIFHQFSHIVCI